MVEETVNSRNSANMSQVTYVVEGMMQVKLILSNEEGVEEDVIPQLVILSRLPVLFVCIHLQKLDFIIGMDYQIS